jgi:hypothetical protein
MAQNTSSAVMQQRTEPHDSLDDFPTPPWATRALCRYLREKQGHDLAKYDVREPAANRGHMVDPLAEYFGKVIPSDIHDYGMGYPVQDFLFSGEEAVSDWVVTNPPFQLAAQFVQHGMDFTNAGVAMFVRTSFVESRARYKKLFHARPPSLILQFVDRVVIHKGLLRNPEVEYWDQGMNEGQGGWRRPSSATSYCWIVWEHDHTGTAFDWLAYPRKEMERPGDYPANPGDRK